LTRKGRAGSSPAIEALKGKWVDEGPAKLWAILARTWDEIHEITELSPLLEPQRQALQRANGFV